MVRAFAALLCMMWADIASGDPLRVVVISDLNGSYGSLEYAARVADAVDWIIEDRPDLVISTGDMVAGQRTPLLSENHVQAMWASFHATVSAPLEQAAFHWP